MPVAIPFKRELDFEYGVIESVSPLVRRIVARNPSAFTLYGTGTYIIGRGKVAIIDPGPDLAEHVSALLGALDGEDITHLVVTHTHRDHSPACRPVQAACGAKTYGYGPHGAGKREAGIEVEEGGDRLFAPDIVIRDGDIIEGDGWTLECVFTPGHTSNHVCFQLREEKTLFSGDHVMGWSTSIISPPDGDMADYMASLERLLHRDDRYYWPTHGPRIDNPKPFVQSFIAHRNEREEQILQCLKQPVHTIDAMVPLMYKDLPEFMYPAAGRSVFAALIYLVQRGRVACDGRPGLDTEYYLPGP